ncbi:hypothetical protein BD769DRAFT_1384538 [Suillus cothurnatus]|nr:hypothetical protein BD769DRAFT_1384538 [Suillus cothurnatus]
MLSVRLVVWIASSSETMKVLVHACLHKAYFWVALRPRGTMAIGAWFALLTGIRRRAVFQPLLVDTAAQKCFERQVLPRCTIQDLSYVRQQRRHISQFMASEETSGVVSSALPYEAWGERCGLTNRTKIHDASKLFLRFANVQSLETQLPTTNFYK